MDRWTEVVAVVPSDRPDPSLLEMLRRYSYRKGKFTLASGKESDFYIDCKQTFLRRSGLWSVAGELEGHIVARDAIAVAGEGVGGAPLAAAISMYTVVFRQNRPLHPVIVRKQAKDHGTGHRVERVRDVVPDGSRVVLVEDVLTSGGCALKAAEALQDDGLKVVAVIALVSRREGAEELFFGQPFELVSLYKREDFVDGW